MSIDYVRLPIAILQIDEINTNQKIILALVASLRQGLKLTNDKIADILRLSTSRVSCLISELQRKGYVRIVNPQSKYRTVYLAENSKVTALALNRKQQSKRGSTSSKPKSTSSKTTNITEVTENNTTKGKIDHKEFMGYWNAHETLPKIHTLTQARKDQLQTRCKEKEFTENWKTIIDKLAGSAFHTGDSKSGWKATVDWILKNENNYVKILELPEPDFGTREVSEDEAEALMAEVLDQ